MTPQELAAAMTDLKITAVDPDDPLRAALYLPRLQAMRDFLAGAPGVLNGGARGAVVAGGQGGLGPNYGWFAPALVNPSLLQEYADSVSRFVSPAIVLEMRRLNALLPQPMPNPPATLAAFYSTHILNANNATWNANLTAFYNRYPVTRDALLRLETNFKRSIINACERIWNDRNRIQDLFADEYANLNLLGMARIRSTGSDFHKEGQQVLILYFKARYWPRWLTPRWMTFRLVYKPSDIEVDCLIAGNSQAINAVVPNFMTNGSLVEKYNSLLALLPATAGGAPPRLPTYKFLPRRWMSVQPEGAPVYTSFPVLPSLYGYIEFLAYEETGFYEYDRFNMGVPTWRGTYWPFGVSDFTIFRGVERPVREGIIQNCYRQLGQLAAMACTFSITDLHLQNVRIHNFQPYLIDLEISLGMPLQDISATYLLAGNNGGINSFKYFQRHKFVVRNEPARTANTAHQTLSEDTGESAFYRAQNRLYVLSPSRRLVAPEPQALLRGIQDGIEALACANLNSFDAAWTRFDNTLVRDLPYTTGDLQRLEQRIYDDVLLTAPLAQVVAQVTLAQFQADAATDTTNNANLPHPPEPPVSVAMAPTVVNADFENLDLPIYYRRIDQLSIVDSRGQVVPLNPMNGPNLNGRPSYYLNAALPGAPPAATIPLLQAALAPMLGQDPPGTTARAAARQNRTAALHQDVLNHLQLHQVPTNPVFNFQPL